MILLNILDNADSLSPSLREINSRAYLNHLDLKPLKIFT